MKQATPVASARPSTDALASILRMQIAHYDRLLAVLEQRRTAIAQADGRTLELLGSQEKRLVDALGDLDLKRRTAVMDLSRAFRADGGQPMRVREIASLADPPDARSDLIALADALEAKVRAVQAAHAVVRKATNALSAHLAGVMQVVQGALSQARVYSRRGCVDPGAPLASSLDITS